MDPATVLRALDIDDVQGIERLQSGLGGTLLWRVRRRRAPQDLVLRVFLDGGQRLAEREAAAHQAARSAPVPAPEVINTGVVGGDGALLMAWSPGTTVLERLRSADTEEAHRIGVACGRALGRLHRAPVTPETQETLRRPSGDWISWAGDETAQLRGLLSDPSLQTTALLHLDFHPENILINNGQVAAVIDWANARTGPPAADLARSRSIHWLINLHPAATEDLMRAVQAYESGLLQGHREIFGPCDHSWSIRAWALAAQFADLKPMINIEGAWIGQKILDEIWLAYQQALTAARATA